MVDNYWEQFIMGYGDITAVITRLPDPRACTEADFRMWVPLDHAVVIAIHLQKHRQGQAKNKMYKPNNNQRDLVSTYPDAI